MSRIRRSLRPHVERDLREAREAERRGDVADAWRSLERAHILSQPSAWLHTRTHAAMLRMAIRERDGREVVGQLLRLAVAALGSALGRFPAGNIGRATVPATLPMPIPDDLQEVFRSEGIELRGTAIPHRRTLRHERTVMRR
jgi:hypothetical protein